MSRRRERVTTGVSIPAHRGHGQPRTRFDATYKPVSSPRRLDRDLHVTGRQSSGRLLAGALRLPAPPGANPVLSNFQLESRPQVIYRLSNRTALDGRARALGERTAWREVLCDLAVKDYIRAESAVRVVVIRRTSS